MIGKSCRDSGAASMVGAMEPTTDASIASGCSLGFVEQACMRGALDACHLGDTLHTVTCHEERKGAPANSSI